MQDRRPLLNRAAAPLAAGLFALLAAAAPAVRAMDGHDAPYSPDAPTLFDGIPNWGLKATNRAVMSGLWNEPSTWSAGRIPNAADTVLIPAGVTVTLSDTRPTARTVVVSGTLRYLQTRIVSLSAATVLVRPDGTLTMGTPAAPVTQFGSARLVLRGDAYAAADDPNQHANGLLVLGKWTARGPAKASFLRLASAPRVGATMLTLAAPAAGWSRGDKIALPDSRDPFTRHVASGRPESFSETAFVAGVSADGRTVTLAAPLRYDHPGSSARPGETPFFPHALNLTRAIEVSSAEPNGRRAHVLAGGSASVDIENVRFGELGRTRADALDAVTNRIGRYALHFHHCAGPFAKLGDPATGYRARVVGAAFDGSPKWQVSVHGTSRVLLQSNAFWGARGSAVVTEDGNERDNEIVGNIAANVPGVGNEEDPGVRPDPKDFGSEGAGFWLSSGGSNLVKGNVAADCGLEGFVTFPHAASTLRYPLTAEARSCCFAYLQLPQIDFVTLDTPFQNNEAYAAKRGFEFWRDSPFTVRDNAAWNCHNGLQARYTDNLVIDGFVSRGQRAPNAGAYGWEPSAGVNNRFFPVARKLRRLDIAGSERGVSLHTPTGLDTTNGGYKVFDLFLEDSRFRCPVGVYVNADLHYKKWFVGPSRTYVRRCAFESPEGMPLASVIAHLEFGNDINILAADEVWVEDYQNRAGDNWRLYYPLQAPGVIVPHSSRYAAVGDLSPDVDTMTYWDGTVHFRIRGLDVPGLTNAQAWAQYGKAIAGSVSPTAHKHPEMGGFALSVPSVAVPLVRPKALRGRVEEMSDRHLHGWLVDDNDTSHHVGIDVWADGVKVGTAKAADYYPEQGRRLGYRWEFPAALLDGREHTIRMTAAGTNVTVPGYPVTVRTATAP